MKRQQDRKLIDLDKKYEKLEFKQNNLEKQMSKIEENITSTRQELLNTSQSENFSENEFIDNFIKASYFCKRNYPELESVIVTDKEITACDGSEAIIIKSNIPNEFKNSKIKWNVRGKYKEKAIKLGDKYLNVKESIKTNQNIRKYFIENCSSENFYNNFTIENLTVTLGKVVKLSYKDLSIIFSKKYIETALMALQNHTFSISLESKLKPMTLECEDIKILILPIRM